MYEVRKEGTCFIIPVVGKEGKETKFDCKNLTCTSYTGKVVKRMTITQIPSFDIFPKNIREFLVFLMEGYNRKTLSTKILSLWETLFSLNVVNEIQIENITEKMKIDKKFIDFLRKNQIPLSEENFKLYDYIKKLEQRGMQKDLIKIFYNMETKMKKYDFYSSARKTYFQLNFENMQKLLKIIKNSFLSYEFYISDNINLFTSYIREYHKYNIFEILDINRTLSFNIEAIKKYIEDEKNKSLTKNLQEIKELENLFENEKYLIVVPKNVKDLISEGKMQHNCVGHFYNKSIKQGQNLIYFIRKKEDPNHSYITCRFNRSKKATVEFKKICNTSLENKKEREMIKEIDNIINKILN